MSEFDRLPKQPKCLVKITTHDEDKNQLERTLIWLLTEGRYNSGGPMPICEVESADLPLPDMKNPNRGILIHWNVGYRSGERIKHWFEVSQFNVSADEHLPLGSPYNLIWIDIGPGSSWK